MTRELKTNKIRDFKILFRGRVLINECLSKTIVLKFKNKQQIMLSANKRNRKMKRDQAGKCLEKCEQKKCTKSESIRNQ